MRTLLEKDLSSGVNLQQEAWYALYARSRHEKVVDDLLRRKGIETFLPVRKIKRRWSDRVKLIEEPLFKGYLFVHAPLRRRIEILDGRVVSDA